MHAETPHTKARDGAPQWGAPEASDLQHPEESGLAQSLRFYVAHANAGTRNMCDSPVTSDIFRYPPESRTAAAVALAADKEDRLLHLVRGYGCAVVLANLLTTFLCSTALMFLIGANAPASTAAIPASFALTRNIRIIPAGPATTLEEALSNPRSVLITVGSSLTGIRLWRFLCPVSPRRGGVGSQQSPQQRHSLSVCQSTARRDGYNSSI